MYGSTPHHKIKSCFENDVLHSTFWKIERALWTGVVYESEMRIGDFAMFNMSKIEFLTAPKIKENGNLISPKVAKKI